MTFPEVIRVYLTIILEFSAELYIFLALCLHKLERRKNFVLRLTGATAAYAAVGLPVSCFYVAFGNTVWGRILVYLFLFAVATGLAYLCFKEPYLTVLFCCSMAYGAQNLVYKLFLIFWTAGEAYSIFDGWGENFDLYYRLVYYSFIAAAVVAVSFVFIRGITAKLQVCKLDYKMLGVTVFVLGITIVLCSFEDVYFAKLCVIRENRFDNPAYCVLRQTGNIFSVVCCIVTLLLASKTLVENKLMREVEYLKYAVRQSEKQYGISKDTIDLINIKCHDIKYKINALTAQGGFTPESLNDIKESISIYDCKTETGNQLLNVLITEKSLFCEQNGITLSCMADGGKLDFIESGDLYCLFGNLLDNALEAVKAIEEKERRIINLVIKTKDDIIIVQEENYFDGTLEFKDGLPATTKDDKNFHGFGMRSLRMIVKKYGGELTTYVTDDIFHLNIILPLPREKRK